MTSRMARRRPADLLDFSLFLPALLLAFGPAPLAWAGTIYHVDADGSPGGDGSIGNPWMTITEAMQSGVLTDGDAVLIAPGDYDEALGEDFPIQLVSGVTLQGPGDGSATCDPDGGTVFQIVNHTTGTTVIDGLRFAGQPNPPGPSGNGGVIRVDHGADGGDVRIRDNQFEILGAAVRANGVPDMFAVTGNSFTLNDIEGGPLQTFCDVNVPGDPEGATSPRTVTISGNTVSSGHIFVVAGPGAQLDGLVCDSNLMLGGRIDVDALGSAQVQNYSVSSNILAPSPQTSPPEGGSGGVRLTHGLIQLPPEGGGGTTIIQGPEVVGNIFGPGQGLEFFVGPNCVITSTTIYDNSFAGFPVSPITELGGDTLLDIECFGDAEISGLTVSSNRLFDGGDISASFHGGLTLVDAMFVNNELTSRADPCAPGPGGFDWADLRIYMGSEQLLPSEGFGGAPVVQNLTVSGNTLMSPGDTEGCLGDSASGAGKIDLNFLGSVDAENVRVENNSIVASGSDALEIDNCVFNGDTQDVDVTISGNTVLGSLGQGIELSFSAEEAGAVANISYLVQDNTSVGAMKSGIEVQLSVGSADKLPNEGLGGSNLLNLNLVANNNTFSGNLDGVDFRLGVFGSDQALVGALLDGNNIADNQRDGVHVQTVLQDDLDSLSDLDLLARYNAIVNNQDAGFLMTAGHFSSAGVGEVSATLRGNTIRGNGNGKAITRGGVVLPYAFSSAATNDVFDVAVGPFNTIGDNDAQESGPTGGTGTDIKLLALDSPISHVTVDATRNWWGTTDTLVIEDRVEHNPDDASLGTVDFSCPLPDPFDFTAAPFHVTANGGQTVTLTADPKAGFVPYVGRPGPMMLGDNPHNVIEVTLGGLDASNIVVAEDNLSLTFESPGGLSYGPAKIEVVNPEGQTGSFMVNINEIPVAVMDSFATDQKTHIVMDVAANDEDANGSIVEDSVAIVMPPDNGNAVVQADGTIFYLPNTGFFGTDTLTYTIEDDEGANSLPGVVTIEVAEGCGTTIYCIGKETSQGGEPRIGGDGQPSVAVNDFKITLHGAQPSTYGIVIASATGPDSQPFLGGTLCVAPPFVRSYETFVHHSGIARIDVPLGAEMIDQKLWFQWWLRDPGQTDGTGVAFSDAMLVLFCE